MAGINWGAGFSLSTPELLAEAREREGWGDGKVVAHSEYPRWIPAQRQGILAVPEAPKREPNGQPQRATTRAGRMEPVKPTPETAKQIKLNGPTCIIQRLAWGEMISQQQAQALADYAKLRRKAGMSERPALPVEGRMQPQAGGGEPSPEAQQRAKRAYDAARAVLTERMHIAVAAVCDQRLPRDYDALKEGARALVGYFVRGERAA